MKILLLLMTLLHQNDVLMKQGSSSVELSDLDAYVYLLPPEKRSDFINDNQQIEKNLITILNMNIVHDFVLNSELNKLPIFEKIPKLVGQKEIHLDDEFYIKMGLEKSAADSAVRKFIEKQEYYARMLEYIKNDLLDGKINQLAKEYFLVNKSQWVVPEKRDLSVILIKQDSDHYSQVKDIMNNLIEDTSRDNFRKNALLYSDDSSVQSNQGDLSYFNKDSFTLPFVDQVFMAEVGVIPSIFKYKKEYYLVRVNEIVPNKQPVYVDHEQDIKEQLSAQLVDKKFQNIINAQATHKIEVNPEVMAHVFERYKIFTEE